MSVDVRAYMNNFLGYGNAQAQHWFVGMEEGGVSSVDGLMTRVNAWRARGSKPLEDLVEYHHAIGETRFFTPPYPLQSTWKALLRFEAAFMGDLAHINEIRLRQYSSLGRPASNSALVELLPLPSTATAVWPYAELAISMPDLSSRAQYEAAVMPARIEKLKAAIEHARPKFVLFYGSGYLPYWRTIAAVELRETSVLERRIWLGKTRDTLYVVTPHPVATGLTSKFWQLCGVVAGMIVPIRR